MSWLAETGFEHTITYKRIYFSGSIKLHFIKLVNKCSLLAKVCIPSVLQASQLFGNQLYINSLHKCFFCVFFILCAFLSCSSVNNSHMFASKSSPSKCTSRHLLAWFKGFQYSCIYSSVCFVKKTSDKQTHSSHLSKLWTCVSVLQPEIQLTRRSSDLWGKDPFTCYVTLLNICLFLASMSSVFCRVSSMWLSSRRFSHRFSTGVLRYFPHLH